MKQERYYSPEIIKNKDATIKHFKPEANGRDRFGNRIFSSSDLAYLDRGGDKVKAGLLVSPEGQSFIESHKGILHDIEYGLSQLESLNRSIVDRGEELGNGRYLEKIIKSGQSNVYLLTLGGEKYIIKTHRDKRPDKKEFYQPYINEMLQTQSIALDLKKGLEVLGVKMATFLFASGQVSCVLYEEDSKNYPEISEDRLKRLIYVSEHYVTDERKKENPLWENTFIDNQTHILDIVSPDGNFRKKPDGTLVWIDPFMYVAPES